MVSLIIFQIFDGFSNVLIDFQAVASSYFHFAKSVSSIIFQVLGYIFRRFQILIFFYQCFSSFHSLSHIFASIFRSCNNLKCFIRQFFEWSLVHAKTTDTILLYLGCLLPYHGSGGWWFWWFWVGGFGATSQTTVACVVMGGSGDGSKHLSKRDGHGGRSTGFKVGWSDSEVWFGGTMDRSREACEAEWNEQGKYPS